MAPITMVLAVAEAPKVGGTTSRVVMDADRAEAMVPTMLDVAEDVEQDGQAAEATIPTLVATIDTSTLPSGQRGMQTANKPTSPKAVVYVRKHVLPITKLAQIKPTQIQHQMQLHHLRSHHSS